MTPYGHFIVAVGYQETDDSRKIIAYDPYGEWLGKTCQELPGDCQGNYNRNTMDPTSSKGRWAIYNIDKLFGKSNGYLITVHQPSGENRVTSLSLADPVIYEKFEISSYQGIPIGDQYRILLPIVKG